jgi:hypothetical protein
MKRLFTGLACVALGFATTSALAKDEDNANPDRNNQNVGKQDADHNSSDQNHQHGHVQTIRGTVAGVTTVGEAVIDPKTNTAVEVEADYLTVLGSPRRADRHQQSGDSSGGQNGRSGQANRGGRQNVYLVAITPQTAVRLRQGGPGDAGDKDKDASKDDKADKNDQNQAESRQAYEQLEIGDRVEVEFLKTDRVNAASGSHANGDKTAQSSDDKTASGSADHKKHGRNRIMIGDAKSITILSTPEMRDRAGRSDSDKKSSGTDDQTDKQ